jgi:hypothetical protein
MLSVNKITSKASNRKKEELKSELSVQSVGDNSNPDGTRSIGVSVHSVHSVREKKLPCEIKKIHTLSVYHFSFETQSWHWVVTTATPRMASRDALDGKPQAFEWSVLLDSFDGILRASGREPTRRRKQWRNARPIEIYRHKQDIFEYSLHISCVRRRNVLRLY